MGMTILPSALLANSSFDMLRANACNYPIEAMASTNACVDEERGIFIHIS